MKTLQPRFPIILLVALLTGGLLGCHGGETDDVAEAEAVVERALAPREVRLVLPEVRTENPGVQLVGENSATGYTLDRVGRADVIDVAMGQNQRVNPGRLETGVFYIR